MCVPIVLVERRRQLVSRTDIVERLWCKDVFVDVDTWVRTAVMRMPAGPATADRLARRRWLSNGVNSS